MSICWNGNNLSKLFKKELKKLKTIQAFKNGK